MAVTFGTKIFGQRFWGQIVVAARLLKHKISYQCFFRTWSFLPRILKFLNNALRTTCRRDFCSARFVVDNFIPFRVAIRSLTESLDFHQGFIKLSEPIQEFHKHWLEGKSRVWNGSLTSHSSVLKSFAVGRLGRERSLWVSMKLKLQL